MINNPPPFMDLKIRIPIQGRGLINHESVLGLRFFLFRVWVLGCRDLRTWGSPSLGFGDAACFRWRKSR